jgi:hypothetical protein
MNAPTIEQALVADGWQVSRAPLWPYKGEHLHATKRIIGIAPAGQFAPDGARIVSLVLDPANRLKRIGPWGDVEATAYAPAYASAGEAIAAALSGESS